jgi:membrane-associated protease RseP (regulator of RpoE activity)
VDCLADTSTEIENKEPNRIEFNFPLLTIRTKIFSGVFDRLGSFRTSRWISWGALIIVPIVAAVGLFLLSSSLLTLLWTPVAREATRELGPASYLLLPGVNPIIPIFYGWFALFCSIIIHEGAHGIIARNRGLNVKSSGLLFFLIVPIGAFVDVDEKQIEKAKSKDSLRVMAAGIGGNVVAALACLVALLIIVNGLTPTILEGVYIFSVDEGLPAEKAGLLSGDVFVNIDNVPVRSYDDLVALFENKNPGDTIQVTVKRGENWEENYSTAIKLTNSDNRTVMGVRIGDIDDLMIEERLNYYKTITIQSVYVYIVPPSVASDLIPFSDFLMPFYTHPIGTNWHIYANLFYWVWFVNINVAIFNALPIYPLDGGRMFDISLKSILGRKLNKNTISKITYGMTAIVLSILLLLLIIPFIF